MPLSRGPKGWPNPNPLAQQGGAPGAGLGQNPRGLQESKVEARSWTGQTGVCGGDGTEGGRDKPKEYS